MDCARGLAIILVVYGHCFRGVRAAGLIPAGTPLDAVDYVIYCFHMPAFFVLSGLFGVPPALGGGRWWRRRAVAILHPYLLWMTAELVLLHATAGITNAGAVAIGPATYLYAPIAPFWFLYVLLICIAFITVTVRLPRSTTLLLAIALFAASRLCRPEIAQEAGWGILAFTTGAVSAPLLRRAGFQRALASPWLLGSCLLATVAGGLTCHRLGLPYMAALPVAASGTAALFGVAARLAAAGATGRRSGTLGGRLAGLAARLASGLGRISLTVLVVHVLGTAATRIALVHLLGVHAVWLHLLAGTVLGVAGAVAVQVVSLRLGLTRILGLPRLAVGVNEAALPTG